VAAELAQFLVGQETVVPAALRDGSSTGIFGPSVDSAMVTTVNHEIELADWNKVRDSTDPNDVKGFLERFPTGIYARRAQIRLDQLVSGQPPVHTGTEPANRPQVRVKEDTDSTRGPFASTVPFDGDDPPIPVPAPKVEVPSVAAAAKKKPRPSERKNTVWYVMLGGAMCGLVIALLMVLRLNKGEDAASKMAAASPAVSAASAVPLVQPSAPVQALPAQPPMLAASAEEVILTPPPAAPVSKPAKASAVAVSQRPVVAAAAKTPQQGASAPQSAVASAPRPVVVAKPKPAAPPPVASPEVVVQHEAPVPAVSLPPGEMPGPTQPGQACAGKSFFARIPCLAHQCRSDKYRDSQECVHYRSLERNRDDRYSIKK
jgi:eukaryotic-like serine/threonine-protein kinase